MSEVVDNANKQRFELPIDGLMAKSQPRIAASRTAGSYSSTQMMPYRFTGQGIGSQIARGVFDAIRASGGKVVLRCSFMGGGYHTRHPEYSDIVIG
jgi:predicted GNAT family acetyltransferase